MRIRVGRVGAPPSDPPTLISLLILLSIRSVTAKEACEPNSEPNRTRTGTGTGTEPEPEPELPLEPEREPNANWSRNQNQTEPNRDPNVLEN